MKEELDKKLCIDFPNLYRQRNMSMTQTAMCWGFPGDGWYNLIYELSAKLEAEILKLPEDHREYVCAVQVKEKFGGLRFYMSSETDAMSALIHEAVGKSYLICEECGKPGALRVDRPWHQTLCEEHK